MSTGEEVDRLGQALTETLLLSSQACRDGSCRHRAEDALHRPAHKLLGTPLVALRCSDCDEQLGGIYVTSVGLLHLWIRKRERRRRRNVQTGQLVGSTTRRTGVYATLLEELPDQVQLMCSSHGPRWMGSSGALAEYARRRPRSPWLCCPVQGAAASRG